MASSYALPANGGNSQARGHGHSRSHHHSYSGGNVFLSPGKPSSGSFPTTTNGYGVKKAGSNGSLYTHAETSRDTSPLVSPLNEEPPPFEQTGFAFEQNANAHRHNHHQHSHSHNHSHSHSHSHSTSPMRRPRGDSDLGRATNSRNASYNPTLASIPADAHSEFSLNDALTSILVTLPYMLASAAYSSTHGHSAEEFPPFPAYARPLPAYARLQHGGSSQGTIVPDRKPAHTSGIIQACILTSATFLLSGLLAKLRSSERSLDKRKDSAQLKSQGTRIPSTILRVFSLGLPFYASMHIGGMRVGLILLILIASNLTCPDTIMKRSFSDWKDTLVLKKGSIVMFAVCLISDFTGLTFHGSSRDTTLGYTALFFSAFVLPPVLPTLAAATAARPLSKPNTPVAGTGFWSTMSAASPLVSSAADVNATLVAGGALSLITGAAAFFSAAGPAFSVSTVILTLLSVGSMASAILFTQPYTLRNENKAGLGLGCFVSAACAFLYSPDIWPGTICNGGISALSLLAVLYDDNTSVARLESYDHDHDHAHNTHKHHNLDHAEGKHSMFTKFLLSRCEPGSLFFDILSEKDSRRIAYFTTLNFGFMFIQGVYGYLSGSLGLLSDTVHMFFDCLGLVVGLGAAVASKWPISADKPYGWGKLNTLAGFGNGVFLMLVSVEFVWEAIEGMLEAKELRHVRELLVVSVLGFLVNMVGLFAFGHAHAGHDHGHSHGGHDHGHSHGHDHGHGHDHTHSHSHSKSHKPSLDLTNGHVHSHDDDHTPAAHAHHDHNENMEGIFLHVAADAGGSLAVILSTALTLWKPWYLWDPLATIIIAVLIFAMAVPLVTSSGKKLLLVIPDSTEYSIKNALQDVGELRGVVGYAIPRFWLDDKDDAGDAHGHHHHGEAPASGNKKVLGVIHIIVAAAADLEDVRARVDDLLLERNMDLVIHVERESDIQCWCRDTQKNN